MTKYQEKKFKNFLGEIEDMNQDLGETSSYLIAKGEQKIFADEIRELRKTRIEFFKWFKKQI